MAAGFTQVSASGPPGRSAIGERLDVTAVIPPSGGLDGVEVRIGDSNDNGAVIIVDVAVAAVLGTQLLQVARAVAGQSAPSLTEPCRDPDARMGGAVAIGSKCHCGKEATAVVCTEVWGDEDLCKPHAEEWLAELHGKPEAVQ